MNKNTFEKKITQMKEILNKYDIKMFIDDNINPEQLSCEFHKHNDKAGTIMFRRNNEVLVAEESGLLDCCFNEDVYCKCGKSFDSDHDTGTFEEAMDIHTDRSLNVMRDKIYYSANNWFNVYCGADDNTLYEVPDDDVIYSLEEMLDISWILKKFKIASV